MSTSFTAAASRRAFSRLGAGVLFAALAAGALAADPPRADGPVVTPAARALHESLLTLDTHLDTPANLGLPGWDILRRQDVMRDGSQIDVPRMIEGGLDGGFWVVYTPQGPRTPQGLRSARDAAFARAVAIREMVAASPQNFGLALAADDAARIAAQGKRVVFMSIENSYPLETDLSLLQTFYNLGVRLAGPVHFANNGLADSSTDLKGPEWNGLSEQGRAFVAEANRLGIVLDGSHSSDTTLDQMVELSKTPVLLSHSGLKSVYNHLRNITDDSLRKLAAKGGVIQINFLSGFLIDTPRIPERQAALEEMTKRLRKPNPTVADREAMVAARREIDQKWPVPRASFEDAVAHLLRAIQLVGIDHVGIGADFDGGGGVTGFEDARDYPKITARLLQAGYGREDIQKVWSGNVLRVMRAAEAYARVPVAAAKP
jgi:membrane dipeptidase